MSQEGLKLVRFFLVVLFIKYVETSESDARLVPLEVAIKMDSSNQILKLHHWDKHSQTGSYFFSQAVGDFVSEKTKGCFKVQNHCTSTPGEI